MLSLRLVTEFMWKNKEIFLQFSDSGLLGIGALEDAYVVDQNGKVVAHRHVGHQYSFIRDVSYCCGKFGFLSTGFYGGHVVLIFDERTNSWKKIKIHPRYTSGITLLKDGFLVGYNNLAYFDFDGNKRWDIELWEINRSPAVYNDYIYVARYDWPSCRQGALSIVKLSNGEIVKTIRYSKGDQGKVTKVCGNYLAVGTTNYIRMYDISDPINPRLMWIESVCGGCFGTACGTIGIAFSHDCRYVAVADEGCSSVKIFDTRNGKQVYTESFENTVSSVTWWRDTIAIGTFSGEIALYEVVRSLPYVFKFSSKKKEL